MPLVLHQARPLPSPAVFSGPRRGGHGWTAPRCSTLAWAARGGDTGCGPRHRPDGPPALPPRWQGPPAPWTSVRAPLRQAPGPGYFSGGFPPVSQEGHVSRSSKMAADWVAGSPPSTCFTPAARPTLALLPPCPGRGLQGPQLEPATAPHTAAGGRFGLLLARQTSKQEKK